MMTPIQAQTYKQLWQKVEEVEKKNLPRSVIDEAMAIYDKALQERNAPQMMKAFLTMMAYRGEISPDSIEVDMNHLKSWAEDERTPEIDQAILYSILGGLVIQRDFEQGNAYLDLSLKNRTKLLACPAKQWNPMVKSGETSCRYLDDNLYELLARRAIGWWQSNLHRSDRDEVLATIYQTYQSLLSYYQQSGKRSAWLLTALDAFPEADAEKLQSWIKEYGDLDVCAEVYLRLSQLMINEDQPAERLALVREAIRRYPRYERIDALKNVEKEILSPRLNLSFASIYPNKLIDVKVDYRNLKEMNVRIYRLHIMPDSPDWQKVNEKTVEKYGKLFRKESVALQPTTDYRMTSTRAYLRSLPEGAFYLLFSANEYADVKQGVLAKVDADMQIYRPLPESKLETVVLDKLSGKPQGEPVVSEEKNRWPQYRFADNDKKQERISLFTDRAIYRPGQTVYFSGVYYEQQKDSVGVVMERELNVSLVDVDQKEISSIQIQTNDFGTFNGTFVLPEDGQTGLYRVKAGNVWRTFHVEEYKRPTFDVVFDTVKTIYQAGDSIQVTGIARTFAGAPVQLAKVSYSIEQMEGNWWRRRGTLVDRVVGEAMTDAEGRFSIPVHFLPIVDESFRFYTYAIQAEVCNWAGETQSGSLDLPLSSASLQVMAKDWKETWVKEQPESITWEVVNLMGQPMNVEVVCEVFQNERKMDEFFVPSNQSYLPKELYELASGKYTLKVSVKDHMERCCTQEYPFTIFSQKDTRVPFQTSEWSWQSADTFPATILYGSSEKDVTLFYDVFAGNKRLESKRVTFSDSLLCFPFEYKEEYGDGVLVSVAFVKDNNLFTEAFTIRKPQPDKSLCLKWKTFRDKLQPGENEIWSLSVHHPDGSPADAQLMATMYDASLDAIVNHRWNFNLSFYRPLPLSQWLARGNEPLWASFHFPKKNLQVDPWEYSTLEVPFRSRVLVGGRVLYATRNQMAVAESVMKFSSSDAISSSNQVWEGEIIPNGEYEASSDDILNGLRTDLAETAFFYPILRTDKKGIVSIEFTLPESLTEWKFMGLAHTKDMDYGSLFATTVATKEFMVQPNMPRFVRVGDEVSLSASLINLSEQDVIGNVRMELFNPVNDKVYLVKKQRFLVTPQATTAVHFGFEVLEEYEDLAVRWIAEGDRFSDGEQHILPVLSNKQWITQSVPFYINGKGTSTVSLESLFNHHSKSVTCPKMTVEFAGNPGWYAVQALLALQKSENEDALSWSVAYYAHSLTEFLAKMNPGIASQLNQDTLGIYTSKAIRQLRDLQDEKGAWSWYKGMKGNRYMTTQIVEQLTRLQTLTGGCLVEEGATEMYAKALRYLADEARIEYDAMKKREKEGEQHLYPSEQILHYLYICALNDHSYIAPKVNEFFIDKLVKVDNTGLLTIYGKARAAIILQEAGKITKAKELLESIGQYSVYTDELGRYFDTPRAEYSWYSYKIPTQVAVIEAVQRISKEEKTVEELKRWLLQQKRTQDWKTPIATADAVYALLNVGENVLTNTGECQITLGKNKINIAKTDTLTYVNEVVEGNVMDIRSVTVKKATQGIGWGAVYATFQEDMDEIGQHDGALSIHKEIYRNGQLLHVSEKLKVGDKLTVRLIVKVDRDMDFIEVRDERAACMEPIETLSGYRWMNGLGYYQRTKDASTSFYMDRLRKGTYVLTYDVYVNLAGVYQEGIATVQSVYAPEFNAYEGGSKLVVE